MRTARLLAREELDASQPLLLEVRSSKAILHWLLGEPDRGAGEMRAVIAEAAAAGDHRLAGSVSQNLARKFLSVGDVDVARQVLADGERHAALATDSDLTWHLGRIRARLDWLAGDVETASKTYWRLIHDYGEQETAIGSAELIMAWSRNKSFVFDEAIEFFLETNQAGPAYRVALKAKRRTYVEALSSRRSQPAATSASEIALILTK
jgi:hypothetical protein